MSFLLVKNSAETITTLTNVFFGSIPRPQKLKSRRIKNAKKITYYQWKSFAFQTIAFFCNVTCLVLITIYTEFHDWITNQDQVWFMSDSIIISAVCSSIFHTISYINDVKVQNLTDETEEQDKFLILKIIYGIFKAIILIIHPNEYLSGIKLDSTIFNQLNSLLGIICYFRIIFVYCFISKISRYYGTRISRLLSVYGHRSKATNIVYAIKCLFKQKGMIANSFLLFFTITFLSLISILVSDQNSLLTQMYYCIETMATIGYGQFAIVNPILRFIFVLAIISGSFAASVFTIDLLQFLQLNDKQHKAYRLIKRLQYQDLIYKAKRKTIQKFFELPHKYTKKQPSLWKQFQKELQTDKSPMLEFLTVKYTYFCNSLKMLLERQLLSNNLLMFYFNRRINYQEILEKKQSNPDWIRPSSKRRVEDSYKLYAIKQKLLGYKK